MVKWTHFERESCLVVHALLGKVLEYLLERGLADAIFSNSECFFLTLKLAKDVTNSLVFFWHSDLVEVTALFKKFNLLELFCEELDELEAKLLCVEELDKAL